MEEMIIKMSKYNIFVETENNKYVYNSFSGSVVELDKIHYKILKSGKISQLSDIEIEMLTKQGILISEECNEKSLIKYFFNKTRYENNLLGITIVPTLECNFSCAYCYEKELKGRMSDEKWIAILNFIKNIGLKYDSINITFYGGEPLLELKAIYKFLESYSNLDKSIIKKTKFDMVTNGYLLTKDTIEKLVKYNLKSFQITIDGNEEMHNKRRPHKKNNDSYKVIVNNIHYALIKSKLSIRTNVDLNNSNFNVNQFLNDIGYPKGNKNLHLYTGILVDDNSKSNFKTHTESSFSKCYLENYKKALSRNAAPFTNSTFHLSPKDLFCGADLNSNFCFLPNGSIINCWNHLSSEQEVNKWKIGEINNSSVIIDSVRLSNWMDSTSITSISDECDKCNLLPICLSGCPKSRAIGKKDCCYPKYWLTEYITSLISLQNSSNNTSYIPTFI